MSPKAKAESADVKALKRLLSKLSALRKTLRGEERRLLDEIVLNAQSEVIPHGWSTRKSATEAPGAVSEIMPHSMTESAMAASRKIDDAWSAAESAAQISAASQMRISKSGAYELF